MKRFLHPLVVAALFCVFVVAGCGKGKSTNLDDGPYISEEAKKWKNPSDEEAEQFGEALETSVANRDIAAFSGLIDWEALVDRAIGGIDVESSFKTGFERGMKSRINETGGFADQVMKSIDAGGSYDMLRVHTEQGEKRVLCRIVSLDGLNYHDFVIKQQSNGRVRAVDVYIFLSAEMFSKTLRRPFLMAAETQGVLQRLSGADESFLDDASQLEQMATHLQNGNGKQALEVYETLSDSMQQDKNVLLIRIQAAGLVDSETYLDAIDDFRKRHPDDPCVDMMAIDGHLLRERYDETLAAIDRLDKAVGGDPYLNVLRANTVMQQGKYDEARKLAKDALAADDDLVDAQWALISASLQEENYDETLKEMKTIRERYDVEFLSLDDVPEYAGFVESPQYDEWLEYLADNP